MYAQVEKPKENQSRAVANTAAQKKSNVKQGFGFVDNRPEVVAQRKLQEMTNKSPQATLISSLLQRNKGDLSPLQLKALANGKLNVVGENHSESNRRRDSEETIAKRETGGGYWREGEYRKGVDTRNLLSWVFTSDKRERGDSSELLVEMNAAALADLADIWVAKATNYGTLRSSQKDEMVGAMPDIYRFGSDVAVHNGRIQDDTKKKDALVRDAKSLLTIIKAIGGRKDINTYTNLPEAIADVRGHLGGRSRAQISTERTVHMQSSAAFDASKPGVWKVGQNHIDEWGVKTGPYEVLTRDEFNIEYADDLHDD